MLLIISTYFNNPHFIEYQHKSFEKKIKEPYDFIILNDAKKNMKCLLKPLINAKAEIRKECKKYNIKEIIVDQKIHKINGGAGQRHTEILNWFVKDILDENDHKKYKYMLIIDSDVFILKKISINHYLRGCTFCGPEIRFTWENSKLIYPDIGFLLINFGKIPLI